MAKERLDLLLTQRGMAPSREKAKAFIMAGEVFVNGEKCDKAGQMIPEDAEIIVKGGLKYVSRGGLKLEKAMNKHHFCLNGKICMDVGASTGGFTDCMLQNGASKVYSVDVGYGQLAWKLRTDPRVVNMERTNARYLTRNEIPDEIDFATVDVSFISLTKILPVLRELMCQGGEGVVLVKPQFEAGRENVGKKGVVRDPNIHQLVIEKIYNFCCENGFTVLDIDYSPVKGPEGNIEYLFYLCKSTQPSQFTKEKIRAVVEESHNALSKPAEGD